jgi:nicotinate-nucleotide pyrophosphorylase (carboxylating)
MRQAVTDALHECSDEASAALIASPAFVKLIDLALAEDIHSGDVTTEAVIGGDTPVAAYWLAKQDGVFAGLAIAEAVFRRLDPAIVWQPQVADGAWVSRGDVLVEMQGIGRAVLSAERIALNLAQRASGIATAAAAFVERVAGTSARILDTRKTVPGLRALDKWAVAVGGGSNHRFGLFDLAMIKDNHIAAAGGIAEAVARVRAYDPAIGIEVEAACLADVQQALEVGVDMIMLDNMHPAAMAEAVAYVAGRARLEASGNITLDNVAAVAATGVDFISIGALTHSVSAFDISQRVSQIAANQGATP